MIVKSIIEFRLKSPPEEFNVMNKLYKNIIGTEPKNVQIEGGINTKLEAKKGHIVVGPASIAFASEDIKGIQDNLSFMQEIDKIKESINFGKLTAMRVGFRSFFVETAKGNFEDSKIFFREKFFNNNNLFADASDLGIVLDFDKIEVKGKLISGPMQKTQLSEMFLEFKADNCIPSNFFFADVDVFSLEEIRLSPDNINSTLNKMFDLQKRIHKNWLSIFK